MERSTHAGLRSDSAAKRPRRTIDQVGGRAGGIAALAMLALQLGWRAWFSQDGAPSFPELVVGAVARLTSLGIFGYATENLGSLAQNGLFVAVLVGTVVVGVEAGSWAGRLGRGGRLGEGAGGRIAAGMLVGAGLLLFTLVVVVPIANLGLFGRDSRRQGDMLLQLITSFGLFGLVWAALSGRPELIDARRSRTSGERVDRRTALARLAMGVGGVALLGTVGAAAWRLMRPTPPADRAASERAAREIRAAAEARSAAADGVAPTSAPIRRLQVGGEGPVAAAVPEGAVEAGTVDGAQLFAELDETGLLTDPLTSVADFYHVSKNISDPIVDGEGWTVQIGGLVERPLELSYDDLVARSAVKKITTLGCISNEINGDLIGTAEWQGLPLRDLLTEVGVDESAIDLVFRCSDDYEDSIPVAQGMDPDTLLVVGMNGEPLTPDHGYPARMIVPGIYGMKNVKWLTSIEVVDVDFKGYWQTRGWSDPAPYQIWGRIDQPESGTKLDRGPAVAAGVASAGDRGVDRVEVSLDDGEAWADAVLEPAINAPFTWVRWAFPFEATTGKHQMKVRITNGDGEVATDERQSPLPDGATGWPERVVQVRE